MAKSAANLAAKFVCDEAIQLLGGYGYSREYPVERAYRDIRGLCIGAGTVEIQRNFIGSQILRGATPAGAVVAQPAHAESHLPAPRGAARTAPRAARGTRRASTRLLTTAAAGARGPVLVDDDARHARRARRRRRDRRARRRAARRRRPPGRRRRVAGTELARGRPPLPGLLAPRRDRRPDPPARRAPPRSSGMLAVLQPAAVPAPPTRSAARAARLPALLDAGGAGAPCPRRDRRDLGGGPLHVGLDRGPEGRAAHPAGPRVRRPASWPPRTGSTPTRRDPDARPAGPRVRAAQRGPRRPASCRCAPQLMARWDPEHGAATRSTTTRDHVHDRAADLLRRAHRTHRASSTAASRACGSCRAAAPG